jgi:hypothetical protein
LATKAQKAAQKRFASHARSKNKKRMSVGPQPNAVRQLRNQENIDVVEAEIMTEGDEFIAAMRMQPCDTDTKSLMTLDQAVAEQRRAIVGRVMRS